MDCTGGISRCGRGMLHGVVGHCSKIREPLIGNPLRSRPYQDIIVAENPLQPQKDEWRDHVLSEIVSFLSENKDLIHARYFDQSEGKISREVIEEAGLMDFELAITFLEDKPKGFGLGLGFFKANLIR